MVVRDQIYAKFRGFPRRKAGTHPIALLFLGFLTLWAPIIGSSAVQAADKSAAMVVDANTGKVLYARKANARRHPASLTKMMTLFMVFDEIKAGRLSFNTPIKMTATAAKRPPSKLGLKPGSTILLKHAIRALVTKSANDIAAAVAEHIAGSEYAFARRMTKRARAIGMTSTTFKNASGLTHKGQLTTARDMITLALRLQDDYPQHFHLFSTRNFKYRGKNYRNHNTLLRSMRGVNGIKTGYTRAAGFNLVTSMHHGRKHVVAAVFGGKTARARNARMRSLLYRTMRKASTRKTRRPKPMLIAKPARAPRARTRSARRAAPRPAPSVAPRQQRKRTIVAERPPASPAPLPFRPAQPTVSPKAPTVAMARVRPISILPEPRVTRTIARRQPATVAQADVSALVARPAPERAAAPVALISGQHHTTTRRPTHASAIRGRAPSTLNQQAAQLTGGRNFGAGLANMQGRWGLNGPRTENGAQHTTAQSSSGPYQIQVGAFPSAREAERVAQDMRQRLPQILNGYRPLTIPVTVRGKQFWRVRFAGFVSSEATRTCNELRRKNVDCFVARP